MTKIKYGQIGVGHAHASKFSVYRDSADYEVVGIAEPDEKLRRAAGQQPAYKDVKWLSVEELLNTPGLQVVGVETQVKQLLPVAKTCLEAGMHVHVDKPAGTSLARFREVLDIAARKHRAVQLGYMYRYSPAVVLLREFLRKGWLGEPFEVHAVMSKQIGLSARRELEEYPGGTMFELGCHLIDLVQGILGTPDAVQAFPRHSSRFEDTLQDNMLAVLEYPRATATIRSSVNEVDGGARRHLVVCGSEGTFHIQPLDSPAVRCTLSKPQGKYAKGYQDIKFDSFTRYVADAADLAKIVRGEKQPDFSYEFDYQVQKTVLLASGLPVEKR